MKTGAIFSCCIVGKEKRGERGEKRGEKEKKEVRGGRREGKKIRY